MKTQYIFGIMVFIVAGAEHTRAQKSPITRDDVASFLSAMTDDVELWHLKSDPKSKQRGTLNEFVVRPLLKGDRLPESNQGEWGQWVQASAGDTYHSGGYYTIGMIHAWRATGEERYRKAATTQQLPLITRMAIESDTLFPEQVPTIRAGVEMKIKRPMKGYIPFWWDDGSSIYIKQESTRVVGGLDPNPEMRRQGYPKRISQHLAQTLGVMFLEGFWIERDPRIAEAARLQQSFYDEVSPWGNVPAIAGTAGYMTDNKKWLRSANVFPTPLDAATRSRADVRYPRDKRFQAPSFMDGEHYRYYADLAKNGGRLSDENTLFVISCALNHSLTTEAWSDEPAFQPGIERYDRNAGAWHIRNGKPVTYRSKRDVPMGSRVGPQHLVFCSYALQAVRENAEAWDGLPKKAFPKDIVVPIQQREGSDFWSKPIATHDGHTIELASRRHSLRIRGKAVSRSLKFRIRLVSNASKQDEPMPRNPEGIFEINATGLLTAKSDNGEPLTLRHKKIEPKGDGFTFDLNIPYTRIQGQNEWINGADHYRYELSIGDESETLYFLTPSREVNPWLEDYLARGLANWKRIFDEEGYIPATMNRPVKWGSFDKSEVSHLYGYAFLTSACAQYLIYLDGKNYWDLLPGDETP